MCAPFGEGVNLGVLGGSYRKTVLTIVISDPINLGVGEVSLMGEETPTMSQPVTVSSSQLRGDTLAMQLNVFFPACVIVANLSTLPR